MSAILSAPVRRPTGDAASTRLPRGVEAAGALVLVAAVVLVWALAPTYPNYDSYYHLVWGRELADGLSPTFEAYAAPTQHPLWVAAAAVVGLAGESGDRILVLICLLSFAALIAGTYRLGAAVFGRWPGVAAAVFVASSASFQLYAARGYVDMPFLALVIWAAVLEADHGDPRTAALRTDTTAPMALLVLAGLLRPEAWVLAGLYWLWVAPASSPRRRIGLAAAVAAAPILWALADLAVTGDPLHSLNATSELADDLGRERGLGAVPGSLVSFVGATTRPPVAILAVAGLVIAMARLGPRAIRIPLALVVAGVATFAGTGVLGLSILPRYLTVPSVALCVFAGYAVAGFTALAPGDAVRRRWARLSAAAVVVGVVGLALLAPSLDRVLVELRFVATTHDDLVALLDDPAVRRSRGCGPITFPTYRLVPDARWHLDAPRSQVSARSAMRRASGVAIFTVTRLGLRRYGFADGTSPTTNVPDPGYTPAARTPSFSAYASCPGG